MNAALHTEADAVTRLAAARPLVIDVVPASEISAHHAAGGVTHAGPPIEPAAHVRPDARRARAPRSGSRASPATPAEALKLVEDGQIALATNHDNGGVGPMAGVVNPSMPVWVARDEATGKVAWAR